MAFKCPNWLTLMYPNDDGTCPHCTINVRAIESEQNKPNSRHPNEIVIKHEQLLPNICCSCGNSTDAYLTIKENRTNQGYSNPILEIILTIIRIVLSPLKFALHFDDNSQHEKIHIRLPMCKVCKHEKGNKFTHRWISFENHEAAFIVHPKLSQEFKKDEKYKSFKYN